jgi:hypothetical protein
MRIVRPTHITRNGDDLSDLFDKEITDRLTVEQREQQADLRWQQLQAASVGVDALRDRRAARHAWRGYGESE